MDNNTENASPVVEEENKEYEVIGVCFKEHGKTYFFDPRGISCTSGDDVIVETARGTEYGFVSVGNKTVPEKEVILPLRPVIRIATAEAKEKYRQNKEKEKDAQEICLQKFKEYGLGMKLVDVEYTFDNSKLMFYFTADGRVDFRELVKDLASVFRTRIELRQIGIRDETKLIGGLGVCGLPFCCKKFLPDFVQVSIKMAKEQNLSLNSQKISGACGRLMCCLKYEQDCYEEMLKVTPREGSVVKTPEGKGIVTSVMMLRGKVTVKLDRENENILKAFDVHDIKILKNVHPKERDNEKLDKELKNLE